MHLRGLKSSLIVNLLLVLAGAMLLIDLVMVGVARREQLRERLKTGQTMLAAAAVLAAGEGAGPLSVEQCGLLAEAEASCLTVFDRGGRPVVHGVGGNCSDGPFLRQVALETLSTGQPNGSVNGGGAFFWPGAGTLAVARPVVLSGRDSGAIAAELSLAPLHKSLLNSQRIFFVYFLINLALFVLLGFFRLYRSIVRPIDRLVATAAEFRDDDQFAFLDEERNGEFNRLSRSLNQMLGRIKRDRGRLEEVVASLEEANAGLRRAQQEIIRAEKLASVGRLSAGIAHEIGNPMGIIAAYLELLKQPGLDDAQRQDFIRRAEGEAGRVNTIIRQLLDFARPPREERNIEIPVHALLEEVRELCAVQPLLTGVTVNLAAGAANDRLTGNPDHLKQVFLNLIINSADAIGGMASRKEPGAINIRTANVEVGGVAGLIIDFLDNGPGFAETELANIFDPFYTTKEPGKGTGLGLSICFSIIEGLGGRIDADSLPEGGARVSLFLPQAKDFTPPSTNVGR